MTTMWRYSGWTFDKVPLKPIEVLRSTENSVWFEETAPSGKKNTRREARETSDWHRWFDTWEQGHAWLVERMARQLEAARNEVTRRENLLVGVQELRKPE